ncbi:MAG: hypothetical protein M1833_001204 [Piccolia ochrophora]|nr:MAG: hypothetical protein M1833_001204 [Piccolia ochrophora]
MSTIIVGAGIIGVSTAYYLSSSPSQTANSIHLIDSSPRLFASASGYAGGFLAKDWFSPAVAPLGALSFRLHKELAEQHNGKEKWGYSRSTGVSYAAGSEDETGRGERGEDWLRDGSSRAEMAGEHEFVDGKGPAWLTRGEGDNMDVMSQDDSTAQLDPRRLCEFLLGECEKRGVKVHYPARALSVAEDLKGELSSVRVLGEVDVETDIPCTKLVITAGAWTPQVFFTLFPRAKLKLPVSSLAGHSLVVRSPRWSENHEAQGCHAVFTTDPAGFSPEIFSRVGGEIYIAGLNSNSIPLPKVATETEIDSDAIAHLRRVATKLLGISGRGDDLSVVREGLCFRPVTPNGKPIISRVPDGKLGDSCSTRGQGDGGVFLSAGHGPWGISMSLGTGSILAELIEAKNPSVDVRSLGL